MPPLRIPWGGGCCCSRSVQQNRETGGNPEEGHWMGWAFNAHRLPLNAMDLPLLPPHEFL